MKKYLLLQVFLLVEAGKQVEKFCDLSSNDVTRQCYVRQVLVTLTHSPNQIAVDQATDHLYFSADSGQGEYIPAKLHLGNRTITVLKGIKDAFAIAYDNSSGEMYFGGSHGIYRYNPAQKKLQRLAIDDLDIWWLVVKKSLYFIKFPSLTAHRYENRTLTHMSQFVGKNYTVHQFVFDLDNNVFFINSTGLFGIKNGQSDVVLLREYPRFMGMATDNHGYVYLCSEDGIFMISKMIQSVKRVVNIQGVLGLTFDRDNHIIYSDSHEIARLIPVSREQYHNL